MEEASDRAEAEAAHFVLILRSQAGDDTAFARLFEHFAPRTLGYLRGVVGQEAEDIHQEVWVRVYRQLSTLVDPRRFRPWLYRVTRHAAIDYLRRARRGAGLFVDGADTTEVADRDTDSDLMDSALEASVLLAQLPPLQREVVVLRYQNDLSYADIASIAGCSVGTVRSRLHYARERLRELRKPTRTLLASEGTS